MRSAVTTAEVNPPQRTVGAAKASGASLRLARYWFFNPLSWIALLALKVYQLCIPPRYKPECRFTPSCSRYMALAIRKYGFFTGMRLGWDRFRHCVGFVPGGEDWP